eukprot:gene13426-14806_t
MAAPGFRNDAWKNDFVLKEQLLDYVKQNMKRCESLSFLKRDFAHYSWSIPSLDRRLRFFEIYFNNRDVSIEEIKTVVAEELEGPGKLLGYRAMHKQIRQKHGILAPRDVVHDVMYDLDPEGLRDRAPGKKRKQKGSFTSMGSNWVHSVDGHDKMMGYQNSTFPLAIYGCMDTCSRKMLWLRAWTTNSDPMVVGKWHLEYLFATGAMPTFIRMDHGSETGTM